MRNQLKYPTTNVWSHLIDMGDGNNQAKRFSGAIHAERIPRVSR
ncbi:MAG: hypothetical protein WA705_06895 [Candidatus Ozemobacteraceae bacterium]